MEKYYFIFYHKIRDSSCLVPLADDGVTDSGYAWESEDGADDGNTAEEINRHRKESSEQCDEAIDFYDHAQNWPPEK